MAYRVPKFKIGTMVAIHWFDAHRDETSPATPEEILEDNDCELMDIGFYIGQKGRFVSFAVEKDMPDRDRFRHIHHIPKVNIIAVYPLIEDPNGHTLHLSNPRRKGTKQGQTTTECGEVWKDN